MQFETNGARIKQTHGFVNCVCLKRKGNKLEGLNKHMVLSIVLA